MNALRARPRRRAFPKDDGQRSPAIALNLLDRQFAAGERAGGGSQISRTSGR
jgi:hypothetical protein